MTETRYREKYINGQMAERIPYEVSDAELDVEAAGKDSSLVIQLAISAFKNWATLTAGQKDRILKGLLADFIVRRR